MDIKIDSDEGNFKFRVCGILEKNGKYLCIKMDSNPFFCLPGGHVELGEDTETAILREMKEELGFDCKVKKLIAIHQNLFQKGGKPYHELGFYYIVEAVNQSNVNTSDFNREELDKGQLKHLTFKWFTLEELKKEDFRPSFVLDCLKNQDLQVLATRD